MKIYEIMKEDGRIVPGVNTTVDVKPGETERQAKKYFGGNGAPKPLVDKKVIKNSNSNTLYNMGLVEAIVKQSDIERVINNIAARKKDDAFPIRFYDGGTLNVKPSTARKIVDFMINADETLQKYISKYLPTYNGFKEIASRAGAVQEQEVHSEEFASDAQRKAAFASGYDPDKKKKK